MVRSLNYGAVQVLSEPTIKTGNATFDEFVSNEGGFVVGSSILLTGTSGAGKTTLACSLQNILGDLVTSLYSREMSARAVKQQMSRLNINHTNAYIADKETCPTLDDYMSELEALRPRLVIVDSLQFIMTEDYAHMKEEEAIYHVVNTLRTWAEKNNAVLIVVGHVTKDGGFEGKNTIKHLFDAHLEMIYNEKKGTRIISWSKNRKGKVGDVLYYEFGTAGIEYFTPAQYETKNKTSVEQFVYDAVINYVRTFKSHPAFPAFKKEMNKVLDEIWEDNEECNMNYMTQMLGICSELLKKHGIA